MAVLEEGNDGGVCYDSFDVLQEVVSVLLIRLARSHLLLDLQQ